MWRLSRMARVSSSPQDALDNQEGHLKGRAVKLIVIAQQVRRPGRARSRWSPQGNIALPELVPRYAVVVKDGDSHRSENRAYDDNGPNRMGNLGQAEGKRPP